MNEFESLKKFSFKVIGDNDGLSYVLNEASKFKFIEHFEIICHESSYYLNVSKDWLPESMKNIRKITFVAGNSLYLKKLKNVSSELKTNYEIEVLKHDTSTY